MDSDENNLSVVMQSEKKQSTKKISSRQQRRKKMANLEIEVEKIFSQEKDDEDVALTIESPVTVTPSSRNRASKVQPQTPLNSCPPMLQDSTTPRRSTRKSIKPAQDYNEIVGKRHLRSVAKEDANYEGEQDQREPEDQQPKWTPAKVGRVSQKRGRRSRKTVGTGGIKQEAKKEQLDTAKESEKVKDIETVIINEVEIQETIVDSKVESNQSIEVEIVELNKLKEEDEQLKSSNEAEPEEVEAVIVDETSQSEEKKVVEIKAPQIMIDNEDIEMQEVSRQKPEDVEVSIRKEENFGIYLKTNNLDISDLGLNPLQADDSIEEQVGKVSTKQETSEVTFLSPSDKLQAGESVQKELSVEDVTTNNDTFDKSDDCIEVTGSSEEQHHDNEMETLQISDDEEEEEHVPPPSKVPRIVVTDAQEVTHTLLSTPRPMQASGSKKRATPYRFSTPYKGKEAFNFTATTETNETKTEEKTTAAQPPITLALTTMEPKEIVLRSIRKRSLSVCIDGGNDRRRIRPPRNVTFHSPANQTVVIEELDLLVAKKDANSSKTVVEPKDNYVTKRRKRSMSFDESMSRKMSRLPIPTSIAPRKLTPNKLRQETPQKAKAVPLRTKLPNFAAIHQKQFDRMENLVDHVQRKNERAKVLTSSAAKLSTSASAQKAAGSRSERLASGDGEKPKAVKKILLDISATRKPTLRKPSSTDVNKTAENLHSEENDKNEKNNKLPLPKPILKPHADENPKELPMVSKHSKTAIVKPMIGAIANIPRKMIEKPLPAKSTAVHNATVNQIKKPIFNLSTSINTTATTTTGRNGFMPMHSKNDGGDAVIGATGSSMPLENKVLERRQRHMEMFKGRAAGGGANSSRSGNVNADGSVRSYGEIIRGVRSNRRFELQMRHRKNLENN